MNSNLPNFHELRKYLLGQLTEEKDLESIEKNMLADRAFLSEIDRVEAELIEEYIAEMMNSEDKKKFETYFLASPQRRQKFRFMCALDEHSSERQMAEAKAEADAKLTAPKSRRGVFSHDLINWSGLKFAAFAALLIVAAGGASWMFFNRSNDLDNGLAALKTAYLKQRPTDARLSPLEYAPALNTRGNETGQVDANARTKAGLLLLQEVEKNPGAPSLRALGLYYASLHEFDRALAEFEKGAAMSPSGAEFYGDHGAVLLETARNGRNIPQEKRFRYLENSLAQLEKALKANSDYLPALFNKAMCLEQMNAVVEAREAWRHYISKDPGSKWTREAEEHLKLLEDKNSQSKSPPQVLQDFLEAFDRRDEAAAWMIVSESKEMLTGTMVSDQLTRGILSADAQKAPETANRMISALSFLGTLEKQYSDDLFFSELAGYYGAISPEQKDKLIGARRLEDEAYAFIEVSRVPQALEKFRQSRSLYAGAGDLWEAAKTDYWISYGEMESSIDAAIKTSLGLADLSDRRSFKWLRTTALMQVSSCYLRTGELSASISFGKEALQMAERTSNSYARQKAAAQIANAYSLLNDSSNAIENIQKTLSARGRYFNSPRQMWRNYLFSAQACFRFGFPEAAVAYGQESVRLSREHIKDNAAGHTSFLFLSGAYKAKNELNDALNAAGESADFALLVDDPAVQNRLLALSYLQQAEVERPFGRCADAVKNYENAIALFREQAREQSVYNYQAYKGRLLCEQELGYDQKVTEQLPAVLKLAEKLRAKIEEESTKTAFFSEEQSIYEFAAADALKTGNSDLAFNFIESGKSRSLLDNLRPANASSAPETAYVMGLSDIRQKIPAGAQMVEYAVLPDRVLIWVVSAAGVHFVQRNVPAAELESKVREMARFASDPTLSQIRLRELEIELDALLVRPVRPFLQKDLTVSIVPDKVLSYLPFEALRPENGNYLLEDYRLSYAPSGTLFALLSDTARKRSSPERDEMFLGVGNPAFDRDVNPGLPDLPAAENEVRAAAKYYRRNQQLTGAGAQKEKITAAMPSADVFHFAGHYAANELSPQYSKFLLAPGSRPGDSDLTVADIGKFKLSKTRLVILSACNTAIEGHYNGEGAIGIARAFFAAGAPTVIASRWAVDSTATAKLMSEFHRFRKDQKLLAPAALRAAQLSLLKDESNKFASPYYWASFAAIGGI